MDAGAVRDAVEAAVRDGVFPGAAYAYGKRDRFVSGTAGRVTYCPDTPAVDEGTVWDLASVSKVFGTTTAAMQLHDAGKLELDAPVASVLPEFGGHGKAAVTFRNLLQHDSGLAAFRPYHLQFMRAETVWNAICAEGLVYATGSDTVYSDLGMIALGKAIERLAGGEFGTHVREAVLRPCGMTTADYRPSPDLAARCAPTEPVEPWRAKLREMNGTTTEIGRMPDGVLYIQGEVHDPTATVLGGAAGHAGVFSTLGDGVAFVRRMLSGLPGVQNATRDAWTRRQSAKSTRGLGWDTRSPAPHSSAGLTFGPNSYGHTGYTGTSVWIDPDAGIWALLFSHRVHPTDDNDKILRFRPAFHNLAYPAAEAL